MLEIIFGTLKSEMFYLKKFSSIQELKEEIHQYINYYNNNRIRLNLKGKSPIEYRTLYYQKII
ncbi:IS3 family transposase [Chryseobacterium sp.]|uniref:IS3 family transposase n=1 Tax=Chryseobacterium sp. TaxID=1871047 RepID=UPI00345C4E11